MSDDHASHAISAYGSRINRTPNLDRIADGGMRFDSVFCTNSICTPSRAAVPSGTYNHVNGGTTLDTPMDNTLWTFPKALQAAGYTTGMFGKWHLGHGPAHDPTGFDEWRVLPGQGHYHNPVMLQPGPNPVVERGGYVTDLITDDCLDFLDRLDDRPFAVLCHHKAPHRNWEPSAEHFTMYDDVDIPEPDTFRDEDASSCRRHALPVTQTSQPRNLAVVRNPVCATIRWSGRTAWPSTYHPRCNTSRLRVPFHAFDANAPRS